MTLTEKAGNLAWCALVALATARQDCAVVSLAQENLFLTRWLSNALKQRRFSRDVTPDIEWLLRQGREQGVRANLSAKLEYLWRFSNGEQAVQSDLFRLTYALDTAREMHWIYRMLSRREWSGRQAVNLNASVNGIYLVRKSLETAFDDNGCQVAPLMVRLTGAVDGVQALLMRCGWRAEPVREGGLPHLYLLLAIQDATIKR
ncbi:MULTISPECIES: DUF2913 family protein [Enterobacteriaceae]|uniref:DUF2913 family protein n=1 Tax=Enterobacteriaceae TaxID=543 RepID=UPI000237D074|nr:MULTISPECIES: DUF2913 family protein [Enterobacteriaceae]QNE50902.1 DUF2913 family protein [Klebsiella michiganensis]